MIAHSSTLPALAYFGDKYDEEKYVPVASQYGRKLKPNWGFWASPVIGDGVTEWTAFCELIRLRKGHKQPTMQGVTIHSGAVIFVVETADDVLYLQERYDWDWEDMSNDFDGVYVTGDAVNILYKGNWDIPSIVFFNTSSFTVN